MTKYFISRTHELKHVRGGSAVHYMWYQLQTDDGTLQQHMFIPCKARLHHVLTGLFYNWDWNEEKSKEITFDEAMIVKHIFWNQKEYKLWEAVIKKISKEGVEVGKTWLIDQVKIKTLGDVVKGA